MNRGAINLSDFGFSPENSGMENAAAFQKALDIGGTIVVDRPGVYPIAKTVYIGSNTSLLFGNNVFIKKVDEAGAFSQVILNKGALTKTYDEHISIENLYLIVNNIDVIRFEVFGLRGQLGFFYVKDLRIEGFRCMDLGKWQFGIQICSFEDITVHDSIIKGEKDGIHLGRGKRFTISNGVFDTFDDAVALNAHDYDTGNPELGWIEDGLVTNCYDMKSERSVGYFSRILAGAWVDWHQGMQVQKSDTVVSNGRLYRVKADPDGRIYTSQTKPNHEEGELVLDGITWVMLQEDVTYNAGVRNVTFRDIFLEKTRTAFSIHFDFDQHSRSYYPGAQSPVQQQLVFDNIRVLHDEDIDFISVATPVDAITICNCSFQNNHIVFRTNGVLEDYLNTIINIYGCVFNGRHLEDFVVNELPSKKIILNTAVCVNTN